jgi:hypothetical protein
MKKKKRGWEGGVLGRLRRKKARRDQRPSARGPIQGTCFEAWRDQRPSARGPIQGTCFETCSKRQPRERLVCATGFRYPSSLRLSGASTGGLRHGPPAVAKNAATLTMGALCVFQDFPHHHCKFPLQAKGGHDFHVGPHLLASCARSCAPSMAQNCAQVLC